MTLYVITGAPAAGKSTYVRDHAQPGDITIDLDDITKVLTPPFPEHDPPQHIRAIAIQARQSAILAAIPIAARHDVYLIHATPSQKQLSDYRDQGAIIITIDPGYETCIERAKGQRPQRIIKLIDDHYLTAPEPAAALSIFDGTK